MTHANTSVDAVFDDLKRRLETLKANPAHDNEATRHDRLIVPVLTHPLLLGWDLNDLVGQASITLPSQLVESHIFRGAQPKFRKPDILVTSSAFQFNALVVEEKDGQPSIDDLNGYRFQLHEYQSLYECVWGLLTDGERWILKKGFESYHTFDSLSEVQAGLSDIQHCIGKQPLLERKLVHGTCDLVIVVPSSGFASFGGIVRDVTGTEIRLGARELLDLGQARSTIIRLDDDRAVLVNTGARAGVLELLSDYAIQRIELIVISNNDVDHIGATPRVLLHYKGRIGRIYVAQDVDASFVSILAEWHRRFGLPIYRIESFDEHPRVLYGDTDSQFQLHLVRPSILENISAAASPDALRSSSVVILRNAGQRFVVSDHASSAAMAHLTRRMAERDRNIINLPHGNETVATNILTCNRASTDVLRLGPQGDTIDRYAVDQYGHVVPLTAADYQDA